MALIKASDDVKYSDDAVIIIYSDVYDLDKTITITDEYVGTFRVVFDLCGNDTASPYGYAKIYHNGSPIGTEREKAYSDYQTFSEDFSGIKLNNGDTIELWGKKQLLYVNAAMRNFRVKFDLIMPDNSMFAVF